MKSKQICRQYLTHPITQFLNLPILLYYKKCFRNLICSNHHTKGQRSMYWVWIERVIISHRWFSCVFYNMTQKTKCRNWINFAQYLMHYKFIAIIFFSYPHLQDFSLKTILLAQWKCWQWPSFKWNILYLWHTQQQNKKLWYHSK